MDLDLDLCGGPSCPRCGCTDTEITKAPSPGRSWYGAGAARCQHCGLGFHFHASSGLVPMETQEPVVDSVRREQPRNGIVFQPIRCPECGSKNTKVARKMPTKENRPTVRYHKCKDCGHSFKSVEPASTP